MIAMTIHETRRARLRQLRKRFRTWTALAEEASRSGQTDVGSPPTYSQIDNGHRNMGVAMARSLENALGYPRGWMDDLHVSGDPAELREPSLTYPASKTCQDADEALVLSPGEELLVTYFRKLVPGQRREVMWDLRSRVQTIDVIRREMGGAPLVGVDDARIEQLFGPVPSSSDNERPSPGEPRARKHS